MSASDLRGAAIIAGLFGLVLVVAEIWARLGNGKPEHTRKLVHLGGSAIGVFLPLLVTSPLVAFILTGSLSLLFAQAKSKFDTAILGAFIKMMGVYPAGSTVQLTDDRYALVVGVNSSRPLKPRVLVHEPRVPRDEALVLDLEATEGLGIRRSLRPQQLPDAALAYLAPRPRVAYFFEPARAPDPGT